MLYDFINIYSGSINTRAEKIFQGVVDSLTRGYKRRDMPMKDVFKSVETYLNHFDYSAARKKRRITATVNNLDNARDRYKGAYSTEFINNYFIFGNAHFLLNGYDTFTITGFIALAAAIWILDELYYKDELEDIYEYLPDTDIEVMFKLIPWTVHPLYKTDLIQAVVQLIFCRDLKEYTDLKRNDIGLILDTAFDRNKTKNEPKQNFESVIKLLDKEHIEKAVKKYENKVWEFYDIAFEIFALFDKEADRLKSEIDKIEDSLLSPLNKNILEMPKITNPNIGRNPFDMSGAGGLPKQLALENELENLRNNDVLLRISDAGGREGFINSYSFIPKKLREKLISFKVDDPFEMAFALVYLLNKDSDIPWLYYGSISILYTIIDALPYNTRTKELCIEREYLDKLNPVLYDFKFDKLELRDPDDTSNYSKKRKNSINLSQIIYHNSYSLYPRVSYKIPEIADLNIGNEIDTKELLDLLVYTLKTRNILDMDLNTYKLLNENEEDEEEVKINESNLNNSDEEITKLQNSNKKLKEQKKELQAALKEEKNKSNKQNTEFNNILEQNNRYKAELNDLRELVFNLRNDNLEEVPDNVNNVQFPYYFKRSIISFGGHQTWVAEMKKLLPDVTFYDADTMPKIDNIKNANEIWIQAQYIPHKSYYRIIDNVDKNKTQIHYFISTGAKRCAEQMVEEDKED